MVARALERSVWERCHGRRFVVNEHDGEGMHETALVGGWERGIKIRAMRQWCCRPKCLGMRIHETGRWRGVGNVN